MDPKKLAPLSAYRARRHRAETPEPEGQESHGETLGPTHRFVVQEHRASTLHWDFRLEADGVLKSWAVPKGPSTDPREKRLAVATEDHPLDYVDFEGVIAEGQYGAGAVIVWDRGTYRNLPGDEGDLSAALEQGHAEIWLEGEKLRGGYLLQHAKLGGKNENWLLIKLKDEAADARRNPTHTQKRSVISGRTSAELQRLRT